MNALLIRIRELRLAALRFEDHTKAFLEAGGRLNPQRVTYLRSMLAVIQEHTGAICAELDNME
jgi:hypothetical protein